MRLKVFICAILVSSGIVGFSQKIYEADPSVEIATKLVDQGGEKIELYLSLSLSTNDIRLYNFRFNFYTLPPGNYSTGTKFLAYQDSLFLVSVNRNNHMRFTFDKAQINKNIVIEVFDYVNGVSRTIGLTTDMSAPLMLFHEDGSPLTKPFSQKGVLINKDSSQVIGFFYDQPFEPGLPPMVTRDDAPPRSMSLHSTFTFGDGVELQREGLYLFQKDSTSLKALTTHVNSEKYPRFTKIEQLIQPLMYITEMEEFDTLISIGNDKKRFDKFWLDMVKDPERAIAVIREFYKRVEAANNLFTTFKQGWKTDMGMIYIVMGEPDRVQKSGNKEIWIYEEDRHLPRRSYQFIRTNTIFSSNHYVLIREKKHGQPWFEAIDLLRKGVF